MNETHENWTLAKVEATAKPYPGSEVAKARISHWLWLALTFTTLGALPELLLTPSVLAYTTPTVTMENWGIMIYMMMITTASLFSTPLLLAGAIASIRCLLLYHHRRGPGRALWLALAILLVSLLLFAFWFYLYTVYATRSGAGG